MVDPTAMTNMFGIPINSGLDSLSQGLGVSPGSAALPVDPNVHNHQYVEQSGKHKGFAGVARDVLGFLGDFLLTRLHMKPMYQMSQDDRKFKAAYQGFDQDPAAAIDRVIDVDPAMGIKLKDQWNDNERLKAQQESTAELRASRVAELNDKVITRNRGIAGNYLNSLGNVAPEKRADQYKVLRQKALAAYGRNDPDLASLLPEEYDPDMIDSFVGQNVPVGTQRRLGIQEDTLQETKQRDKWAHTDRQDAENGRNNRNDTNETGRNYRFEQGEVGKDNRLDKTEAGKDRRTNQVETGKTDRVRPKPNGNDITYLRAHPEMRDRFDGRFGVGMAKRVLGQ